MEVVAAGNLGLADVMVRVELSSEICVCVLHSCKLVGVDHVSAD